MRVFSEGIGADAVFGDVSPTFDLLGGLTILPST